MEVQINELRTSYLWVRSFDPNYSLPPVTDRVRYRGELSKVMSGQSSWTLPWPESEEQHFWNYYLECDDLSRVEWNQAQRHLMPFRAPALVQVSPPSRLADHARVQLECFGYPHGVGCIITVSIRGSFSLDEMVDQAIQASQRNCCVRWLTGDEAFRLPLNKLASKALKLYGEEMTSEGRLQPMRESFRISSMIDGKGADPDKIIDEGDEIHRALEGLCVFNKGWRKANDLQDLDNRWIEPKKGKYWRDGHFLYGTSSRRVVWFPGYFKENLETEKVRFLGKYHRNLTLASLQTKSLLALMYQAKELFKQPDYMPFHLENLARYAAGILGRLYLGKSTYRSRSLQMQIEPHLDVVNKVRYFFGQRLIETD